jgi:hypothetical protein
LERGSDGRIPDGDICMGDRIILKQNIKKIMREGVDWNCLNQGRNQQQAVASMKMRYWDPGNANSNKSSVVSKDFGSYMEGNQP